MPRYNGHRNWDYWNVSLWINNDERLYTLSRDYVRHYRSKTQAAAALLDVLISQGIAKTPDGARYTMASIRAAMSEM
jgi:hypothetical protein